MKNYICEYSCQSSGRSNSQGRDSPSAPKSTNGSELDKGVEEKSVLQTLNTIAYGFVRGEDTGSSRRRYACQVMEVEGFPAKIHRVLEKVAGTKITFSQKDSIEIHPYDKDIMVITSYCVEWEINVC